MFLVLGTLNSRLKTILLNCALLACIFVNSESSLSESSEIFSNYRQLSQWKTYCVSPECDRLKLTFNAWDQHFEVNLKRNSDLFNRKTPRKLSSSSCHYFGNFVHSESSNSSDNWAALSICDGQINGVLVEPSHAYNLHHEKETGRNLILESSQLPLTGNLRCGTKRGGTRAKRSTVRGYSQVDSQTKFVELILVNDYGLYHKYDEDEESLVKDNLVVANVVNSLYRQLNVKIVLVDVLVWKGGDQIDFNRQSNITLNNFLDYNERVLLPFKHHDNAQLLSAKRFEQEVVGKAIKGSICDRRNSGGINHFHSKRLTLVAATVAHEMGHNFGMEHDSPGCYCPFDRCIMEPTVGDLIPTGWSSCSKSVFTDPELHINFDCLKNEPISPSIAVCGNGVLEEGEECDCDFQACAACCDVETCKLKPNAQCGTGICCDLSTCQVSRDQRVCRKSSSECDIEERCDGVHEFCPSDAIVHNGYKCTGGHCYNGECNTLGSQCKLLWGAEAEPAPQTCFDVNRKGSQYGNCGVDKDNYYNACAKSDRMCGLLHCLSDRPFPIYGGDYVTVRTLTTTFFVNSVKYSCRSAIILNHPDPTSVTYVRNGVKCGEDRLCYNRRCVASSELTDVNRCPENCSNSGICDNSGMCHCKDGFYPPTCSRTPPPTFSFTKFLLSSVIILSIVTLVIFITYFTYKRYFKLNQLPKTGTATTYSGQSSEGLRGPVTTFTNSRTAVKSTAQIQNQRRPVRVAPPPPPQPQGRSQAVPRPLIPAPKAVDRNANFKPSTVKSLVEKFNEQITFVEIEIN